MNKTKAVVISCIATMAISILVLSKAAIAQVEEDRTTVISFSRHTFRGISQEISPERVALKKYGIDINVPLLSYAEDATPRGLEIARNFAGAGLHDAAMLAVQSLGEYKKFDGHWDAFRADLSTERTFWTAIKTREGLDASIPLMGCKTKRGLSVDIVSARHPVMKCMRGSQFDLTSDLATFKSRSETFLEAVRTAVGLEGAFSSLPDFNIENKPPEYAQLAKLSSAIEMSAALGAPLPQLFKTADKQLLHVNGKAVLSAGMNMLGSRFFINNPLPVADHIALAALDYMAAQSKGSHTAVFTHDDDISSLIHSLGFITNESEPDQLAIYPMETIVFAFGKENVSVTRMRPIVQLDGHIPGPFQSVVLWKGPRDAWDQKVQQIKDRAWDVRIDSGAKACLKALIVCEPDVLDVIY